MRKKYFVAPDVVVLLPRFADTPRLMQPRKPVTARTSLVFGWLLRLTGMSGAPAPAARGISRRYRERHDPASGR